MEFLSGLELNWWQAITLIVVIYLAPLVKALAVVLVGRCVKPEIAKIALPLMFRPPSLSGKKAKNVRTLAVNLTDRD